MTPEHQHKAHMRLMLIMLYATTMLGACATGADTGDQAPRCPEGRDYGEMFCSEIPRYARDPQNGQCCRYASPCATPTGWTTYPTETACERADED